jgi:hypothetical protein
LSFFREVIFYFQGVGLYVTLKRKKAENAKLMEETATHRTERRIGKDNLPTS